MNEPIGRLNRARISRERYVPGPTEFDPPTYRVSLYDGELSPAKSPARARAEPRQLEYQPRSAGGGLDHSFSRISLSSPPPPPPSKYSPSRSSVLYAKEFRQQQESSRSVSEPRWNDSRSASLYMAVPGEATLLNRSMSAPETFVSRDRSPGRNAEKSEVFRDFDDGSYFRRIHEEEDRKQMEAEAAQRKQILADEQTRRRSHDYRFRDSNVSVDSMQTAGMPVSPLRSPGKTFVGSRSSIGKRTQEDAAIPPIDIAHTRKEIDSLVIEALNLQDMGRFEEAHFLLLKVERLRIEIAIEEGKMNYVPPSEQQQAHPQAQRPRRASLVLEEARQAQQNVPSVLPQMVSPSKRGREDDDDYQEGEFDSLSEEEDHFQAVAMTGSVLPTLSNRKMSSSNIAKAIVVNALGEFEAENHIRELSQAVAKRQQKQDEPEEKTTEILPAAPVKEQHLQQEKDEEAHRAPPVVIPVAHVDASTLEEERERRKRDIRKRKEEQKAKEETESARQQAEEVQRLTALSQQSIPDSPSVDKKPETPSVASPTPEAHFPPTKTEDAMSDSVLSMESNPASARRESIEDVFRRAMGPLALSFPDSSFEPVKLDQTEAAKTLDELALARRRREQLALNPTKSSRLPALNEEASMRFKVSAAKTEERYASKEGFLVKLVEAPRFALISSSFHKRYFVLSGGVLLHLKNEQGKVPRGMISLENASVRLMQCKGIQHGYCIVVESPQRNYTLFPKDRKEAVEWAVAIEHNAQVFSRLKYEEAGTVKQLVRRQMSRSGKANSSNMLSEEAVTGMIGKDVTADDFVDITQLAINGGSMKNLEGAGNIASEESTAMAIGAYYDLLGVTPTATTEAIRKSYHKLAKMFHPDKNTTIDAKQFAQINRAFHVVQDPETRERYNLGERVKHALRRGVLAQIHMESGDSYPAALYVGPTFTVLYWQDAEFGSVLQEGFKYAELRFVQECIAGEDDPSWPWAATPEAGKRCMCILGQRLGHPHIRLELDTEESRDEILDGLRILRCEQSMLFVQKLEEWLKGGNHR